MQAGGSKGRSRRARDASETLPIGKVRVREICIKACVIGHRPFFLESDFIEAGHVAERDLRAGKVASWYQSEMVCCGAHSLPS